MMIGIIGFGVDLLLQRLGRKLFPWDPVLNKG
jgi:NitT/TauT family transport system permease protein